MGVRMRFKRIGRRHRPAYRLTVVDGRKQRDGKVIEELGAYDPLCADKEREVNFNRERIEYWLSVGALPSETVGRLLKKQGIGLVAAEG